MGQSIWYDCIDRYLIRNGGLRYLIDYEAVKGITTNPSILHKAITISRDYDAELAALAGWECVPAEAVYKQLLLQDISQAADLLEPVYGETQGRDGYVCLEVSPHLAHDITGTIKEARRLWRSIGRQNLMIKVPATNAGIAAIETLTCDGINVNATLLFSLDKYNQVVDAYLRGLEYRMANNRAVESVASVASIFLLRLILPWITSSTSGWLVRKIEPSKIGLLSCGAGWQLLTPNLFMMIIRPISRVGAGRLLNVRELRRNA